MTARRSTHQSQSVSIDFIIPCMFLDPADSDVQIGEHLGRAELCDRARANSKYRISLAAQDVERLCPRMISDFAAIGVPRPANHIYDRQAIAFAIGRERCPTSTDAMHLSLK